MEVQGAKDLEAEAWVGDSGIIFTSVGTLVISLSKLQLSLFKMSLLTDKGLLTRVIGRL